MRISSVTLPIAVMILSTVWPAGFARGALIAAYNPDTLTATSTPTNITSMTDLSGNGNTLTGGLFPTLYGPATAGDNPTFGVRNYANYAPSVGAGEGLITNSLYSGAAARTVVVVYATPSVAAPPGGTNGTVSGFNAGIAGESGTEVGGQWFAIESRNNNVTGDPYLVNVGPDVSSNQAPAVDRLTFAVATYDGTTESLYWAYGVNGSVASNSVLAALNTEANGFLVGEGLADFAHSGEQIGQILVFNTAFSAGLADTEISQLQTYYSLPEPSTFALTALGLIGLLVAWRRTPAFRHSIPPRKLARSLVIAVLICALSAGAARAGLIADFSADSLAGGPSPTALNSWTNLVGGGQNATTTNSGQAAPSVYGPGTAGYSALATAGAGHAYVSFNGDGLATNSALFSGGADRTVVVVYQNNAYPGGTVYGLAGESGPQAANGDWFMLQSRTDVVSGDPYLAGDNSDVSLGQNPVVGQLTFAVASYDGTNAGLSWAYGVTGVVSALSVAESYSTNNVPFTIGFDYGGEFANDKIAEVLVFNSALTTGQAQSEIQSLQQYYASNVPEPSTFALAGIALIGLLVARRRGK